MCCSSPGSVPRAGRCTCGTRMRRAPPPGTMPSSSVPRHGLVPRGLCCADDCGGRARCAPSISGLVPSQRPSRSPDPNVNLRTATAAAAGCAGLHRRASPWRRRSTTSPGGNREGVRRRRRVDDPTAGRALTTAPDGPVAAASVELDLRSPRGVGLQMPHQCVQLLLRPRARNEFASRSWRKPPGRARSRKRRRWSCRCRWL